jgi:DNA-binding NarL/FixJ family response regulator
MLPRPINLAIVDDHVLFRKTLKNFLSEQKNLQVIIQACDISELSAKLRNSPVDVLIMDIFMPGLSGSDAVRTIRNEFPYLKILVLSMSTDMDLVGEMLNFGIQGFISKADEPEDLLQAIQAIANDKLYRNKYFTEALYWDRQNSYTNNMEGGNLSFSDRDRKILQMIWEEKGNKEIADELFLGIRSIEKIRQSLKEKIGAKSTLGMLKYAIKKKIIGINLRSVDMADRKERVV